MQSSDASTSASINETNTVTDAGIQFELEWDRNTLEMCSTCGRVDYVPEFTGPAGRVERTSAALATAHASFLPHRKPVRTSIVPFCPVI